MLDAVARVALAVGVARGLVAVQRAPHGCIADGVHGDLEAAPVDLGGDLGKLLLTEQRVAVMVRFVRIAAQHERRARVEYAVHEQLDPVAPQPVRSPGAAHVFGLFKVGELLVVLVVERHLDAAGQSVLLLKLVQQFALVDRAVHVVDRGDAERGAIVQSAFHGGDVGGALGWRGRGVRIAGRGDAQRLTALRWRERHHVDEGVGFEQFASGQPVRAHHDFGASNALAALEYAGGFQCGGVGPAGVEVGRLHGKGSVRADLVKQLAGGRFVAEHGVAALIGENDTVPRVRACPVRDGIAQGVLAGDASQVEPRQRGRALENVHVALDEARHDRTPGSIDDPCGRAGKIHHVVIAANGEDHST